MLTTTLATLVLCAPYLATTLACAPVPMADAPTRELAPLRVPGVRITPCRKVPLSVFGEGVLPPGWRALVDSARAHGDSLDLCQLRARPPYPPPRWLHADATTQATLRAARPA